MPTDAPQPPPIAAPPSTPPPPKRRSWLLYGCGGLLAFLLIIVATVAITIWWIQRPIKPVVLTEKEKVVVDEKLRLAQSNKTGAEVARLKATAEAPSSSAIRSNKDALPDRTYVPGSKVFKLTEREINGLLNANTDLGQTVRLEFARDAINAYIAVPIPKDFPVGGGRMFRARARFGLSLGSDGAPYASLEDVTILGLSLPKAWLGGLKGENLLSDAVGKHNGKPVLQGIKSLRLEPGALVLEVED